MASERGILRIRAEAVLRRYCKSITSRVRDRIRGSFLANKTGATGMLFSSRDSRTTGELRGQTSNTNLFIFVFVYRRVRLRA